MEPLHMTEFGSDRYLQKFNQSQANSTPSTSSTATLPQSQFILPLRGSSLSEVEAVATKPSDQKRTEKRGFGFLRAKFHVKSPTPAAASHTEHQEQRPSSTHSATGRKSARFDQLFIALPSELQVEIIASLPLSDVLNLRLASRSLHALVSLNETPITRYHLDHHVPAYAKRLYPAPEGVPLNFHYLCGIWHRLHVAAKLSYLICEWVTKEMFFRNTEEKKREFAPQTERMRRRLIPMVFTVFHFFETYRKLHLKYIVENGYGLDRTPYTVNPIEAEILNMYDDRTLFQVHEIFPLVMASFDRRLRPPSYVGRVERSLRGYLREKPPEEVHVAILCLGGLREVERVWEVKGYNARRAAVDAWYASISKEVLESSETKKRRGMLGLKRRKSSVSLTRTNSNDPVMDSRSSGTFSDYKGKQPESLVFSTSLSAGMPMGPLTREEYKLLMPDLPRLRKIWSETAEALILDRNIVSRPADIRRNNAQMFTDLISENIAEDEDQWLYGTTAPDSVRPKLDAIEEDPMEGPSSQCYT
ncbi:hypothetical protein C7999DRAFT_28709 [Corynascus novoguineensis]|uniref:F-box domain-containing protein n=1 Tax=Corynascus novoguineensis TaxID=1126955 RepID=A0AAN7CYU0_9PEZI|nr:hypothetical protein C7999DRAFT_28709 [Corynascus novoguineensis]